MIGNNEKPAEEINALEKCFRPFIIKCIQAIVQARSGNIYKNVCMTDVGARNNMMVYIEDDPEIGATIKHSLDSGFSVKLGDNFTVEIYAKLANDLPILEVWHFTIDNENGNSNSSGLNQNLAMDLRKTRFLERLGTLLKSIMVTTRLLPAYWNSRNPIMQDEPMCFLVRRGEPNLGGMANFCQGRSVGSLVVPGHSVSLKVYVHYRSNEGINLLRQKQIALLKSMEATPVAQNHASIKDKIQKRSEIPKLKNRPAFARNFVDYEINDLDDEYEDEGEYQNNKAQQSRNIRATVEDDTTSTQAVNIRPSLSNQQIRSNSGGNRVSKTRSEALLTAALSSSPTDDSSRTRLQLPFCSSQTSCADLSRQLSELKLRDLDMFQSPSNQIQHQPNNNADQQSTNLLSNLNCLKDELLLHERTSILFDDFLLNYEQKFSSNSNQHHHHLNTLAS